MATTKVHHNTIFWYCNDVEPMRHFYTDLLGFKETFYKNDSQAGWLTYKSGDLQIVFVRAGVELPVIEDWGKQPSYEEGILHNPSWVIEVPFDDFEAIIERIKADNTTARLDDNFREARPNHKSFWVRDPMGTTIEVYATSES